jgi:hypothetical protein
MTDLSTAHCPWCARYHGGLLAEWCERHRKRRRAWLRVAVQVVRGAPERGRQAELA